CHAANTFGISFLILFIFRNRLLSCFLMLWAIVTCWSRAYLGVHYPGDLLAGMLLGLIGAALSYWLFGLYCKRIQATKPTTYQHLYLPVVVGMLTIVGMAIFS
ncbi:MAG: phosphatase PAP2 family protein, partial [Bacteroides sp.]|nr:phosphatase PAP2 family protein [Bacteroides sp.]